MKQDEALIHGVLRRVVLSASTGAAFALTLCVVMEREPDLHTRTHVMPAHRR